MGCGPVAKKGLQTKFATRAREIDPSTGEVNTACRTLGLDPTNRPIDMKRALKNKRILARQYHPDMLSGSARNAGLLQKVLRAYELLAGHTQNTK